AITRAFGDVKVIYGGSVDERNIGEYLLVTRGVLVGGASLAADQFFALLEAGDS
ncbi:triose-phosphate isomerase, partial [Candidatus Woesebacteria bacterium]|nr:triose-phosphate isomerase [Candidatus Woesebacteria bacterium]